MVSVVVGGGGGGDFGVYFVGHLHGARGSHFLVTLVVVVVVVVLVLFW